MESNFLQVSYEVHCLICHKEAPMKNFSEHLESHPGERTACGETCDFKWHPKNAKMLKDFTEYCNKHPEERFWQALRNFSGEAFIFVSKEGKPLGGSTRRDMEFIENLKDTFYRET